MNLNLIKVQLFLRSKGEGGRFELILGGETIYHVTFRHCQVMIRVKRNAYIGLKKIILMGLINNKYFLYGLIIHINPDHDTRDSLRLYNNFSIHTL